MIIGDCKLNISIRTKFFIILSIVMALILALQFYFSNQAQDELLDEISGFIGSFNLATDYYYGDVLTTLTESGQNVFFQPETIHVNDSEADNKVMVSVESVRDSVTFFDHWQIKTSDSNSNVFPPIIIPGGKQNLKQLKRLVPGVEELIVEEFHDRPEFSKKIKAIHKQLQSKYRTDYNWQSHKRPRIKAADSTFEMIEIDLNSKGNVEKQEIIFTQKISGVQGENRFFSLTIPDFTFPDRPRLVRYKFSTEKMEAAILRTRNRTLAISLILFIISMALILLISRQFLKPISALKTSFESVVNGDLNTYLPVKSRDEIGSLTNSFNHMVTELKKNREKELLLSRKERLASVGQLAAGVAHEIKNPLNAINLTIDHLKDKYTRSEDEQAQAYIQAIQSEIRRLDKIVNNFLSLLRSENLELQPTNLNELLTNILALLNRELLMQNITVETTFAADFVLEVDPARMKTVIMNVLLNSVQAMPSGGSIKIWTDTTKKQIRITDSGVGIPQNNLENIFDIFYTTKSSGTGLGLPTAHKIMKEHGGEIQIQSRLNSGTEVALSFS